MEAFAEGVDAQVVEGLKCKHTPRMRIKMRMKELSNTQRLSGTVESWAEQEIVENHEVALHMELQLVNPDVKVETEELRLSRKRALMWKWRRLYSLWRSLYSLWRRLYSLWRRSYSLWRWVLM